MWFVTWSHYDPTMRGLRQTLVVGVVLAAVVAARMHGQTPPQPAAAGDTVPLTGLAANQLGIGLWNAADSAPETTRSGHDTAWTLCSTSAPYYLATRDHSTLDATSSAGFRASPVINGLAGFSNALAANGFATTDLTVGWSAQTLGDDVEGADWRFDDTAGVETRSYTGGGVTLQLRGEPLASGPMAETTLTTTYNDLNDCGDDTVSLSTGVIILENAASTSAPQVQTVATALVDSLDGNGVRLGVDALQATGQSITASGRTGTFLEAATGRLDVAAPCSCSIGIHDADGVHEWTLFWPEAALPGNGPLQLILSAVTQPALGDQAQAGMVTLTVFDDSAPTAGVVLDVAFPDVKGEVSGRLDLTVQPQTEYRFTVTRSGGVGRDYRLGASHAALRLSQSGQRYLSGRSQDWAVDAAAGESVMVELATDGAVANVTMATSAFVTIVDPATDEIVSGPTSLTFVAGTPQAVTVQNVADARRLVVQVDPDGAFRMRRIDGDQRLHSQPCPERTALASATLSLIQTRLFTPLCSGCHGGFNPRGGLNLQEGQAFSNLVNVGSSETSLTRVVPGDPESSYLIHKLEGRQGIAGSRMPQGGPFLSDAEMAMVRAWIQSGGAG